MKLIATQTLGSAQPTITFSDIPQNFTDLYIAVNARTTNAATTDSVLFKLNGVTTNQSRRRLQGVGSGTPTSSTTTSLQFTVVGDTATSNTFGNAGIYIPNYAGSTNKSVSIDLVTEHNNTTAYQELHAGLWSSTAAITSLSFEGQGTNFVAGSTISLYGIGGAGDGWAPKATGGIIQKIDGYYVHTFTSSGTFTPTANLSNVEYLVIAGGGGGAYWGGGGGAGGYRSSVTGESSGGGGSAESKLSLTSGTGYTVTIGAGGAGSTSSSTKGTSGSNSVFSTITSTGGGGAGARDNTAGLSGGSGGGPIFFGTVGAGTANQGYDSGSAPTYGGDGSGAGGGGAGSVGSPPPDANTGGNGGSGVASSITGSSVTRAAGGRGGNRVSTSAVAGGANTGTGGGGAGSSSPYNGAAGGSGIVVVRYAA